jgi:hypothetical protein
LNSTTDRFNALIEPVKVLTQSGEELRISSVALISNLGKIFTHPGFEAGIAIARLLKQKREMH